MNDPVIISSNRAWHYRLITYVFSAEFFLEIDSIDIKAMDSVNMEKDFEIIYKKKPRTVNLCPYCRAVVGAIVIFPFVILWRLFPHKEKKRTRQEIMKRAQRTSNIVRGTVVVFFLILAFWHLFHEAYIQAAFNFGLVAFNIFNVQIFRWIAKRRSKPKPYKEPKEPSKIVKKLSEKHDLICPPIFFIDVSQKDDLT